MPTPRKLDDLHLETIHKMRAAGKSFREIRESGKLPLTSESTLSTSYRNWMEENGHTDAIADFHNNERHHPSGATITGVHFDYTTMSDEELWEVKARRNEKIIAREDFKSRQRIDLPDDGPVCIALFSDLHLDDPHADLRAIEDHADMVRDIPRMYGITHGDWINNMVIGKLMRAQMHGDPIGESVRLFRAWLRRVGPENLLAVCAGNHDQFSVLAAGIDIFKHVMELEGVNGLYDTDEIRFNLGHAGTDWRWIVRHQFRRKSCLNQHHGAQRHYENICEADFYVSGHIHESTSYLRTSGRDGHNYYSIVTGTYKRHDKYGKKLGFGVPKDNGCCAVVLIPGEDPIMTHSLHQAARMIT